ncbi:dihydroorotase [Catalinimonas alkaloidigena]|uniref:amidohydrolase/deacetylase family metallohydrolase n=1 Tax=Catalinimonas alkaloidigena TaxID=1075417 RepID=UPI002404D09D|nr:amidohydrolase/deacetylase family metallohydrolase [Catalinimonas alkaloidigena]MDF9800328.1 dihydroorotase [Catalinimonas alkaloidigena]
MHKLSLFFSALACLLTITAKAQTYDIVIKGGHLIDPKNNINETMDIAINDGTIARVAKNIDTSQATQVVTADDMYITPGLIDMHTHNFWGTELDQAYMNGPNAVAPDGFTFRNGVTTVVDAGSSGWRTFPDFKAQTIDISKTRVLAFLNIVGEGMRGGPFEQSIKDMDAEVAGNFAKEHAEDIVGIKLAHYNRHEWTPTDRAVEAGKIADIPVMVDFGGSNPPLSIEELFMEHLRPGDIFTHCYGELDSREAIVNRETKKVKPFVWDAREQGIIFDVGYGGISFAYSQAIPAVEQDFTPSTISTDLHIGSMNNAMKDMLSVMSKFLNMGMDVQSVITASTWKPAQVIQREELGHLTEGAPADVAILTIREGDFGFFDYTGYRVEGDQKFECQMTIREGKIVYDLNGIADPVTLRGR